MVGPFLLALFNLVVFERAVAYPFGAPACVAKPRHGFDAKPLETLPVQITKTKSGEGEYEVRMSGEGENCFKGFIVMTKNPGEFETTEDIVSLSCDGSLGSKGAEFSAVTHSSAGSKCALKIFFTSAEGAQQTPEFIVSIVKDYGTYWTEISV